MQGSTSSVRSPLKPSLDTAEVWLCSFGTAFIGGTLMLLQPTFSQPWQAAMAAMIVIGGLHGVVFWALRRRQRAVRHQAIQEITRMLQDRINNELAVIQMNISLSSRKPEADLRMLRLTQERVQRISQHVRSLSEESLDAWKARYETSSYLDK
ncbi:MAG: hypothetical protein JO015_13640 [Verrucomicrobia bacterium]|nr:hypothetical protein [Verrucomicrobiota bacterium]